MNKTNGILPLLVLGVIINGPVIKDSYAADAASLAGQCEDCHGKDGASQEPKIPIIGGYSATYITDSLAAYRDETRPCPDVEYPAGEHKGETTSMCKVIENLSEEDEAQIADYFAAKPFVRAKQDFDADLAAKGKGIHNLRCKKCHEDGGSSPDDDAGILAGQWTPYLESQFEDYSAGKRAMTKKMKPKMDELSADDIKALIQYFASFQ